MSVWSRRKIARSCWILLPAVVLFLSQLTALSAVHDLSAPKRRTDRELIVKFRPGADPEDKTRALRNATSVRPLASRALPGGLRAAAAETPPTRLEVNSGVDLESEIARLEKNPSVEYVEPNFPLKLFAATNRVIPNDFEFPRMYALQNPGGANAKTNADISAPAAWAFSTGHKGIVVAVIDTGIDYLHEDLAENIWINPGETPWNGIDDDGNGYIDDYHGFDFVSEDSDPFDDHQHGTHVAGTIGAKGNNGLGTVGVCWDASLMAVKAFDENGNGTVGDAIAAISYAIANGARIINASWGLDERSKALEDACQAAADAGVLIIAAAGNNRSEAPAYPASFETVLSVGATDARDIRAEFSNFGPHVDVAAPGANILSTLPENKYGILSGTSMAAPHVSGMAALVLARFPNYSREELFDILVNSVDPLVFDQPIGYGRINLSQAVQMDQPLPAARISVEAALSGLAEVRGTAKGSFFSGYSVRFGAGRTPSKWVEIASSGAPADQALLTTLDTSLVPDGPAVVQLVVSNLNGFTAIASAPVRVFNALISFPLSGDVLAPGKYTVRGTVHGSGKTFELFYGEGLKPSQWHLISSGASGVIDSGLGAWDASGLSSGFYSLRMVIANGSSQSEFLAPAIYIDRRLKPGWPAYVTTDADFPGTEWRNVRPADLDGDGQSELVLVDAGTRNREQELRVYDLAGQLRWSRMLGFDIPPDLPAIGDVDRDGKMEIFVDAPNGIIAFHHDGTVVDGWPVITQGSNHAKALGDVDGDGRLELIAFAHEYAATQVEESRELAVYRSDATLVRRWQMPWCGFTNDIQKLLPAVAQLDDEPGLEIVVASGCSEVAAYQYDRPEAKWRAVIEGKLLSAPVIGDVDGDGRLDVIAAAAAPAQGEPAGIYIFDSQGQRWRGWPVLEEFSFTASPALGDLDKDGRLEIVVPGAGPGAGMHLVQWDGFEADGWPKPIFEKLSSRTGAAIADVNGDGKSEVVLPAPGYPSIAISQGDLEYLGGIVAFDLAGAPVPFGRTEEADSMFFESSGALRFHKSAPVVISDLDGNGRTDLLLGSIQDRTYGSFAKLKDRSSLYAWELDTPVKTEWPMLGRDIQNSGTYNLPLSPPPTPTNITRAIRDRVITAEDRDLRIEPLLNDWNASSAPLQLVEFTQPRNGVVFRDGSAAVLYRPAPNYSGPDEFSYTIRDQAGAMSIASVIIRVKPSNDPPSVENMHVTIPRNSSATVSYSGQDEEGAALTYRIIDGPKNGELWNYPAVGTYYPARGFHGVDSFTYVANDGKLDSLPGVVTITVLNTNNPPKALAQSLLTKTNRPVVITPRGTDPDGDSLTFEIVEHPANGMILAHDSAFQYTPAPGFVGQDFVTVRPFDGFVHGADAVITIGVIATNAPPMAIPGSATVQPNAESPLQLSGTDPDGDVLSFILLSPPLHGTLTGVPPQLTYVPPKDYLGPDRFSFKVTDGTVESAEVEFTVQVLRMNRPPESKDQTVSATVSQPLLIALDSLDPDGDPLRAIILKGPRRGVLFGAGTNLTYNPRSGATGSDFFTYKVWDGQKFGNPARVSVWISGPLPDRPPTFTSVLRNNGMVELVLNVSPGKPLTLQVSTNLWQWSTLGETAIPATQNFLVYDTNSVGPFRFYRALPQP